MGSSRPLRGLVLLASLAVSVCAYAEDDLDTYYASDPDRWGAPHVAVAPEYPADALEKRVTGVVKVSGIVAPTGQLEAISYSVEPPSATEFVAAVKEVIGHWLFYTPIGKDCMPSEQPVQEEIWFEIRDGTPHISVSRASVPPRPPRASWVKPILTSEIRYPRRMIRQGLDAQVYARLEVDAAGSVREADAKAWPRSEWIDMSDFEDETKRALAQYTFPPAPQGKSGKRIVCYSVIFRLH